MSHTPTLPTLRADDFAVWLDCQPEGQIGIARSACGCPLAGFLMDLAGGLPKVNVTNYTVSFAYMGGVALKPRPLPAWARRFVRQVDALGTLVPVSRAEAIRALETKEPT